MTFDPTHDKLPDLPVTIGGHKSAAAWHPNTGPEVPHADLIARLRRWCDRVVSPHAHTAMIEAADALAALGDTVPLDLNEQMRVVRAVDAEFTEGSSRHWVKALNEAGYVIASGRRSEVSLALHDAEVKAQALEEAAAELPREHSTKLHIRIEWLEDRAAAIRKQAK